MRVSQRYSGLGGGWVPWPRSAVLADPAVTPPAMLACASHGRLPQV